MSLSIPDSIASLYGKKLHDQGLELGRITGVHKERYALGNETISLTAEVSGAMRYRAASVDDFPAVGDYVGFAAQEGSSAMIHQVLPRHSVLRRQAVAKEGETQILGANIDCALLVQAMDRDFNLNRLERYMALCHSSHIEPLVVLTKSDLLDAESVSELLRRGEERLPGTRFYALSNVTAEGIDALRELTRPGLTYCLLGSSGAGKSSLLNHLLGNPHMRTGPLSQSTGKGRHVTTHRELLELENGAFVIDNPGMRGLGMASAEAGLEHTFDAIARLALSCRFSDCAHLQEKGCAVQAALREGRLDPEAFANYQKLERENAHFESSALERREKDKAFGKMVRYVKKLKIEN